VTIHHHPHEDALIGYASGAANEAISLLVATHLALCPECRHTVSEIEKIGGALLSDLAPVAMSEDAFARISAKLDAPVISKPKVPASCDKSLPEPLLSYLGGGFDTLKWQHIIGGISQYTIMRRGPVSVRLIRVEPGSAVAMHTHRGEELTMVMAGGFTDATGHYNRGDVQTTSPAITHRPATVDGEPCINLAVTDAPLIFQSLATKIIGKLFRF
jgi:putative transcriptional regulator